METKELELLVAAMSVEKDGRRTMPCPVAFKLAAEHDVGLLDIGRACNRLGIQISQCQLGCFR